jgi:hypothetical protein
MSRLASSPRVVPQAVLEVIGVLCDEELELAEPLELDEE